MHIDICLSKGVDARHHRNSWSDFNLHSYAYSDDNGGIGGKH